MNTNDLHEFTELLDGTCALLTGGKYSPNDASTGIFFRALAGHPMEAVRGAFSEHVRRSRFSPTPADLLALLEASDGRPGAEEAWTAAMRGQDEADTVVWTVETGRAFAIALPVLQAGDQVGARMAFKEAYTRLVDEARQRGVRLEWQVMLGHDPARRVEAVKRAMAEGKAIEGAQELLALPAPHEAPLALAAPQSGESDAAKAGKAALLALAGRLKVAGTDDVSQDATDKQATHQAQVNTSESVSAYANKNGISLDKKTEVTS